MIIVGTTLIGFKYADSIKERYKHLNYFNKILTMLKGEIDYNESELNEIFIRLQKRTKGNFKVFFGELFENTKGYYEQSIEGYWNDAVNKNLINMSFNAEDINKIKELGENLGYLDKNMQLKNIEYLMVYVDKEINELENSMDKSIKMYRMFGVLAGIFITIIFC